jgi:hypothetical protein
MQGNGRTAFRLRRPDDGNGFLVLRSSLRRVGSSEQYLCVEVGSAVHPRRSRCTRGNRLGRPHRSSIRLFVIACGGHPYRSFVGTLVPLMGWSCLAPHGRCTRRGASFRGVGSVASTASSRCSFIHRAEWAIHIVRFGRSTAFVAVGLWLS